MNIVRSIFEFVYLLKPISDKVVLLDKRRTLVKALSENLSMARFGDGELILSDRKRQRGIPFQKFDGKLSAGLSAMLNEPHENLLVCFNNGFLRSARHHVVLDYERSPKKYGRYRSVKSHGDIGVLFRTRAKYWYKKEFAKIASTSELRVFGDAACFFLSLYSKAYREDRIPEILALFREFFQDKRILIVCPDNPLMGFSFRDIVRQGIVRSPASIDFIDIPPRNCFGDYDGIKEKILAHGSVDAVFIQAGPTATVLVGDLTMNHGILCYDVGSLNISMIKAYEKHGFTF